MTSYNDLRKAMVQWTKVKHMLCSINCDLLTGKLNGLPLQIYNF